MSKVREKKENTREKNMNSREYNNIKFYSANAVGKNDGENTNHLRGVGINPFSSGPCDSGVLISIIDQSVFEALQ